MQVARYVVACVLGFAVTVAAALLPLGCHGGELKVQVCLLVVFFFLRVWLLVDHGEGFAETEGE